MNRKLTISEMGRMDVDAFKRSAKTPLAVVLDDVRSMYNVGSVFRTADAYRVHSLHLCGITATPPHAEIHKTALGAEDSVSWHHHASALSCVRQLQQQGCVVFAVEQAHGSIPLQQLSLERLSVGGLSGAPSDSVSGPTHCADPSVPHFAVVFGNEVKGVAQSVVDACDACIELPQFGTKHSLNVSSTAAIVIWHFFWMLSQQSDS